MARNPPNPLVWHCPKDWPDPKCGTPESGRDELVMKSERPNPDVLLAQLRAEEQHPGRGKFKVFFGYAAGVGKTYAMLEAARHVQAAGREVVVGYIEPHGRPET